MLDSKYELWIGVYPRAVLTDLLLLVEEKVLPEITEGAPIF